MKLSVIVVSYNVKGYLSLCLDAALAESWSYFGALVPGKSSPRNPQNPQNPRNPQNPQNPQTTGRAIATMSSLRYGQAATQPTTVFS